MSDTILYVIPSDPYWQPSQTASVRTAALMEELCPNGGAELEVHWHDTPAFVNAGPNLETISCPRCGKQLDIREWWMPRMDEAYDGSGFSNLAVRVPCCDAETTLNDLVYDGTCGFARFEFKMWNPNRDDLTNEELTSISDLIGKRVRQVWARI